MPSLATIRYTLDTTGVNSDNYIANEPHALANVPLRAVIPTYGAFYTESLKVYDTASTGLLVKGTDYICTELASVPSELYAKEICYIILITNSAVSSNVTINYQALGGLYGRSTEAILSIYDLVINGNSSSSWSGILNKPSQFNPTEHLHDIDDVYGFEFVVNALERIRSAILIGSTPEFQSILKYIDDQVVIMNTVVTSAQTALDNHASNKSNPHVVTKTQLGLGNVSNLPVATSTDVIAVINAVSTATFTSDKYITLNGLNTFKSNNTTANSDTLAAAKAYADNKDITVLQSAAGYDATVLATAKAFATNSDSAAALSAKVYTDSVATATLSSAAKAARALGLAYPNATGIGFSTGNGNNNAFLPSHAGRWAELQTNGMTISLPDIALTMNGDTFTVLCNVTKATVKTFSSGQSISNRGTSISMLNNETIIFTSNGSTGFWYVTSNGNPSGALAPIGSIIFYDGLLTDLPSNWKLCDGSNGTPNLTNRFVIGANGRFALNSSGGTADSVVGAHTHIVSSTFTGNALGGHSHGVNDPSHAHSVYDPGHVHAYNHHYDVNAGGPVSLDDRMPIHGATTGASVTNIGIYGNQTGISIQSSAAGTPSGTVSNSVSSTGVSLVDTNLPPWYSLYYIKRIY